MISAFRCHQLCSCTQPISKSYLSLSFSAKAGKNHRFFRARGIRPFKGLTSSSQFEVRTPPFTVAGCLPSHTTLVHCRMLRIWTHHQAEGHWHNEMMSNYSPLRDGPVMKPLDPRKDSTAHQGHLDVISPLHPSTGPDWPGHRLGSCRVGCGISSACPPGPFRPARSRTAVHTAQCKAAVKNDSESRFFAPTSSDRIAIIRSPCSVAALRGNASAECVAVRNASLARRFAGGGGQLKHPRRQD